MTALTVTRRPFASWLADFRVQWEQGQHVSLIGPTGQGKTTLTRQILPRRSFVVILASKVRDSSLDRIVREDGYTRVAEWKKRPKPVRLRDVNGRPAYESRVVLWPKGKNITELLARQAEEFTAALNDGMFEGGWCIVADDTSWLVEMLDHARDLKAIWKNGRSAGVSLVANIQRPAFVPHDSYSQASQLLLWQNADERDTRTLSGLGGLPSEPLRAIVRTLPEHEFLHIEPRTKRLALSKVER